ncbi:small integral membrane protein 12 isoform X1 [Salvelinus alpinus]|uniref:small integral membrane protein 12 isoform X1 n=1 Tax=Salvelinus alpinus TaxID=8036 RepID=UPI0039FD6F8E
MRFPCRANQNPLEARLSSHTEVTAHFTFSKLSLHCTSAPAPVIMWPVLWMSMRTYAPYITFPVAFVVGAVGYHLEWFIRGDTTPKPGEEKSIVELREDRKLEEGTGRDSTQVLSLKEKLEFTPRAALDRNRPEKS